jgi:TonB family protein
LLIQPFKKQFKTQMKPILLSIHIFTFTHVVAQDTVWVSKFNLFTNRDSAESFIVRHKDKTETNRVQELRYGMDNKLMQERNYYPFYPIRKLNGLYADYQNGVLVQQKTYTNGLLHGLHKTYLENGKLRRQDVYEKDSLVSGNCYDINGNDTAWFAYEIAASFPGGKSSLIQYLSKNLKYPREATKQGIDGTVMVAFTIDKNGNLQDISIAKAVHPLLDEEALRVVKAMPLWTPAKMDGKLVKMKLRLPVAFRLE